MAAICQPVSQATVHGCLQSDLASQHIPQFGMRLVPGYGNGVGALVYNQLAEGLPKVAIRLKCKGASGSEARISKNLLGLRKECLTVGTYMGRSRGK